MAEPRYKYGGESAVAAFFMPERREILSPEESQIIGYRPSGEAIVQNIPAQYGESEIDFSYTPVVRGARSAASFLNDLFLGDANEQSEAAGKAVSAVRGMIEGLGDYAVDQYEAGMAGGTTYNPETGQITDFDPALVMGGAGASRSLSKVPLDMSSSARMQRAQDLGFNTDRPLYHYTDKLENGGEFNQLSISPENVQTKLGRGIYTSPDNEYGDRYIRKKRDMSGAYDENARAMSLYARGNIATETDYDAAYRAATKNLNIARGRAPDIETKIRIRNDIQNETQRLLKNQGFSGVQFMDEVMIFDPKDVRSVNARFDPVMSSSDMILYSGGGRQGTAVAVGSALRGLDMSQGARMQRAQDLGFDTDNVFYHGAVTDIAEFDLNRGTSESHMGTAVYTTTGTSDASKNYASLEGPDLSNKITRRAEEIIDSGELSEQWADIYRKREVGTRKDVGKARNEASADLMNIAKDIAKEEFNDNLGVVYPLIGRSEKPFDISEGNDTFLSFEYPEFDPKDYLDEADGDMDIAADLARDDSYNFEPEGELTDFLDSIRRNLSYTEYSQVSNAIMESAYDGGISGKELEDIYRKAEIYSEDDLGRLNQMEIFRQGLEDAGFDSIIHDANRFNMDHLEGQKHQIFFKENQLRSPNAEFDPTKADSADLLSNRQSERQMSALRGIA